MKDKLILFSTGMLQVTFVAMNVNFISHSKIFLMLATGWIISWLWSSNVRKISFGTMNDRIVYPTGAMVGTGIGYFISKYLVTII